jgi:hypothetical protein
VSLDIAGLLHINALPSAEPPRRIALETPQLVNRVVDIGYDERESTALFQSPCRRIGMNLFLPTSLMISPVMMWPS